MTLQRQLVFWLIVLAAVVLFLLSLSDILLPFIAGLVLAYFLDPVADSLERIGLPRLTATIIIIVVSVLVFVLLIVMLLPVLGNQVGQFAEKLPGYVTALTKLFNEAAPEWLKAALSKAGLENPASSGELASKAAGWILQIGQSLWSGGLALVNLISLMTVTPIVVFYLLNDWDRMVAKVDSWLPRDHLETIRELARQTDTALAGFIRGQGTVCLVLGAFYAIGLIAAGLNFGLLIGLVAGLLSFIPYVGSIIGGALAIGVALVQFWPDWVSVAIVAGVFAFGQFIEGNFLSPKLVGSSVGLHPVWLMFALFACGFAFGFVGLLLAVPIAATIGVFCRFALEQYLNSPLFLGAGKTGPDGKEAE